MSLKSHADCESFFANFDLNPDEHSLFSWLFGETLASVSLFPEEDIELTMFWISGMTLSEIALLIALFIWLCTIDIIESISCDSLRLNSFEKVSRDCLMSSCLGRLFSWGKLVYWFPRYSFVSISPCTDDCSMASTNSLSMGLLLALPSITSIFSMSDSMSISLDFLAFAFWRLVEGIRDCCKRKEFELESLSLQTVLYSVF